MAHRTSSRVRRLVGRVKRDGNSLLFDAEATPDDTFNGNLIYERLADGTWLEMRWNATGRVTKTVTATGTAGVSYWLGFPGEGSSYTHCVSERLRVTFTPK